MWVERQLKYELQHSLDIGNNILLFGPRQTGKTSLVKQLKHDKYINLMHPESHQKYLSEPGFLIKEITAQYNILQKKPIVIIDECQKIPDITDSIQILIDDNLAQFIITGSSARKIKNLLPGRVIKYSMTGFSLSEINKSVLKKDLDELLANGTLPKIYTETKQETKNSILKSYVNLYIEEEIRKEALVRNIGVFTNFFKLACIESGNTVNYRNIATEIGVSHKTVAEYYQILHDCMLIEIIEPLTKTHSRRRLTKMPRVILFDLGVKRVGAMEPHVYNLHSKGILFEQFIGLELAKRIKQKKLSYQLLYWRSHDGPEVDFVLFGKEHYIPIEVKLTNKPNTKDFRHLLTFQKEYPVSKFSYIVCCCDSPYMLSDTVMAIPWQELDLVFDGLSI